MTNATKNLHAYQKGLWYSKTHDYLADEAFYAKKREFFKASPLIYKVKPQTWEEIKEEKIRVNSY